MFRIFVLAAIALCAVTAHAATWYVFTYASSENMVNFFDFDTVAKQGGKVTIWEKSVNKFQAPDGSYATATKVVYNCSKRTVLPMSISTYDSKGHVMQSYQGPGKEMDIIPGSIGEDEFKVVCARGFPHEKSGKYFAIKDNDVYAAAKSFFDYLDTEKNDPAPK